MRRDIIRPVASVVWVVICALTAGQAAAQAYPNKPMRMIAPYPPGGTSDILARIVSQKLIEAWGERVVVDNRPGVGGSLGTEIAAKASSDGYTLLIGSVAPIVLNPMFYKVRYESLRDFEPVSLIGAAPQIIVIDPALPVKSVKDLIALGKSRSDGLNYGTSGPGTLPHLGGEMFKIMTGVKMVQINYKGSILAIHDLLAGRLHVVFSDMPIALPHAKSGKLRALAVTGSKPFPLAQGIPTAIEAGLPGFVLDNWWGLLVVKGAPQSIIGKLNGEIVKALQHPEVKERYAALGLESVTSTPRGFGDAIKSDSAKYMKVIKDAGIQMN
jgi:tripartite-type tricarboxylate transporter receptor subunit TctC